MLRKETMHDALKLIAELRDKYNKVEYTKKKDEDDDKEIIINYDQIRDDLYEDIARLNADPDPQDRTLEQMLVIGIFRIYLSKQLRRAVSSDEAAFSYLNTKRAVKFAKEFDEKGIRDYCHLSKKLIPHQHNPYKIEDDELKRYIFAKKKKNSKPKVVSLDSDDISRYVFEEK